uniref:Tetratricopeptide repeat protein n=1 Tax=Eiseniibacteriota bacterium TaxID=2212470 RepID=A0A832I388_UNCEI
MLDSTWTMLLARFLPALAGGPGLHRAALIAASRGRWGEADRLFERAAAAYRRDLRVEALACLRAHQLMAGLRCGARCDADGALALEVERRLARLGRIASPEPPFETVEARQLLARWSAAASGGRARAA